MARQEYLERTAMENILIVMICGIYEVELQIHYTTMGPDGSLVIKSDALALFS